LPQWENSVRLNTPTAPSFRQNSALSSEETTATARPPISRTIWMAIDPRPPAPPHTSTGSPSSTTLGGQPISMRYAVAPTRVGAAACSHVRWGALGRHWCAWTLVNWANEPQFDSYPQMRYEGANPGSPQPRTTGSSGSHGPHHAGGIAAADVEVVRLPEARVDLGDVHRQAPGGPDVVVVDPRGH